MTNLFDMRPEPVRVHHGMEPEDICESRHGGSATSVEAHRRVAPCTASREEWTYRQIEQAGKRGLTSYELLAIVQRLGTKSGRKVGVHMITPRLTRLAKAGRIIQSIRQPKRTNENGSACKVWVTTTNIQ